MGFQFFSFSSIFTPFLQLVFSLVLVALVPVCTHSGVSRTFTVVLIPVCTHSGVFCCTHSGVHSFWCFFVALIPVFGFPSTHSGVWIPIN
jgi:hypothetical protein